MGITYNTYKIGVSKLFCDKLSFTIDYLNLNEQKQILYALKEIVEYGLNKTFFSSWGYKKCMKIYVGQSVDAGSKLTI
jgi:hypothetical protein